MDTTALLVKMISALAVVTGLLFLLLYFLKKTQINRTGHGINDIKVLSVQPIMHKRHLGLVKVRDKLLILGMTENNITLLDTIKTGEEEEEDFTTALAAAREKSAGKGDRLAGE